MPDDGLLLVESQATPRAVEISISDTGVGIPEHEQEEIFEPLFTTKIQGIGLGLAIVRTLVEGHGGAVEVESPSGRAFDAQGNEHPTVEDGNGATFTVRLPIEERAGLQDGGGPDSETCQA